MKLTIDINEFFRCERNSGMTKEKFVEIVGKAVYRSAGKLLEFRDENNEIAIEGAIWREVADEAATRAQRDKRSA